ncbi:Gal-2,6-Sulfurylase [Gracilaria domingensis]|nr:Gal-2,6-Sulfurylase [Gracilaria domingensis]
MRRADEAIRLLSNGSYRGASYWDVALSTAASKEGYDPEEIALYLGVDVSVVEGYVIRHSIAELSQLELRDAAAAKRPMSGPNGYVVPVEACDGGTRRIGMGTVVRELLRACEEAGVRVYYGAKIVAISRLRKRGQLLKLKIEGGGAVVARDVVLNIGKPDLIAMGITSEPLRSGGDVFRRTIDHTTVSGLAKMYCFWEDAWWVTKLNRTEGRFKATGELVQSGRYHDGDVTCRDVTNRLDCRGVVLISYVQGDSYMVGSGLFPHNFNSAPYSPLSNFDNVHSLIPGNMTASEKLLFDDIHAQLRRIHRAPLAAAGLEVDAIPESAGCVYADWRDVGTHKFIATGLAGVNVYRRYTRPVSNLNISLVNEAWGEVARWAESSLRSAERALYHQYKLERPSWMDEPFHTSVIGKFNRG